MLQFFGLAFLVVFLGTCLRYDALFWDSGHVRTSGIVIGSTRNFNGELMIKANVRFTDEAG